MQRRDFVGVLGAAGLSARFGGARLAPVRPIGLQLYTVRTLMPTDFEGTLARIAQIGYTEVEFAGYFDHTPQQVREILRRHHLSAPGAHIGIEPLEGDWARAVADARTIGHKYLIVASIDDSRRRTVDDWRRIGDLFNRAGEASAREGVTLAYHNHEYEFRPVEGRLPLEVLLESTDPRWLKIEMDLYWIRKGGQDALAWFQRWPGRFPLVHVKDMTAEGRMVDVGAGAIDWAAIFAHRRQAGIQHYLVEHDMDEPGGDPIATITNSYRYLSRLDV